MDAEMLERMLALREGRPAPQADENSASRYYARWESSVAFFEPVFQMFDWLHDGALRIPGFLGAAPRRLPSGSVFRELTYEHCLPPQYAAKLNELTTMTISVTQRFENRSGLRRIKNSWKLVLQEPGSGDDIRATSDQQQLTFWIIKLLSDHRVPGSQSDLAIPGFETLDALCTGDQLSRVILLDPQDEEEEDVSSKS